MVDRQSILDRVFDTMLRGNASPLPDYTPILMGMLVITFIVILFHYTIEKPRLMQSEPMYYPQPQKRIEPMRQPLTIQYPSYPYPFHNEFY